MYIVRSRYCIRKPLVSLLQCEPPAAEQFNQQLEMPRTTRAAENSSLNKSKDSSTNIS